MKEYFIYEDCANGENMICLNFEAGRNQMLNDYLEKDFGGLGNILCNRLRNMVPTETSNAAAECARQILDEIKRDLYSWHQDNCIEDFAYMYAAEVIQ